MFPPMTLSAHFCGGVPPIERLPRYKNVALGEMGLRAVKFFQDYDRVLQMAVGEIYQEVGAVNHPPLTPLHEALSCSHCLQEQYLLRL